MCHQVPSVASRDFHYELARTVLEGGNAERQTPPACRIERRSETHGHAQTKTLMLSTIWAFLHVSNLSPFLRIQMLFVQVTKQNIKETNFKKIFEEFPLLNPSYPFTFIHGELLLSQFIALFIISALIPTFFQVINNFHGAAVLLLHSQGLLFSKTDTGLRRYKSPLVNPCRILISFPFTSMSLIIISLKVCSKVCTHLISDQKDSRYQI